MKKILLALFATLAFLNYSYANDTLRMVFIGDIMQHQTQINSARQPNGTYSYDSCFSFIKNQISSADFAVANLELTLAGAPYSGYPCFSAPDEILYTLKNIGFDMMSTANNHCCDKGAKGLTRTIDMLDSLSIPYVGTYRNKFEKEVLCPQIVDVKGFRLAFVAYTYDTNGRPIVAPTIVNLIDTTQMAADIEKAKQFNPDAIIAIMHWGVEYSLSTSVEQRFLANYLFSHGVNFIIGSHPHVIQPMETRVDEHGNIINAVAYSLGNVVSNQNDANTDIGAVAHIALVKNNGKTNIADCKYSLIWRYRPKNKVGRRNFYILPAEDFYERSDFFSSEDYKSFQKTVSNTRKRLGLNNKNFDELNLGNKF